VSVLPAAASNSTTDFMESAGKFYVVIAVILIIFTGIILFLINLDRKLTKLEYQIKDNE
jgi:hypothetical protein